MISLNAFLIILFYLSIIFIIYFNRHKFDIQAKIIALYRTKLGIKQMDTLAKAFPRFFKYFGLIGIGVGFLGMFFIFYVLIDGFFSLILIPDAQAVISPVLPGVRIPGSLYVPFWVGILSIFVVATIHEFSHGVLARVYNLDVKNTGIVFFGPIIGAFVEPDEEKIKKLSAREQLSIYGAGPFSNICTGIIVLLLLSFLLIPFASSLVAPTGVEVVGVMSGFPAEAAGLKSGNLIISINDISVNSIQNFSAVMKGVGVGEEVKIVADNQNFLVKTTENPTNKSLTYIGVTMTQRAELTPQIIGKWGSILPLSILYIVDFFRWLFILSVGIGLANLLPLGPIDGGRMSLVALGSIFGGKKLYRIWGTISWTCLFLLLFNLLFPFIKPIF